MKSELDAKIANLNIAIVTHIFASGPALDLEVFLQNKAKGLIFIGHPFSFTKDQSSFYRTYSQGSLLKNHKALPFRIPSILLYFKELILTFVWILNYRKKIDIYIGNDGYSTYIGLLLKKIGRVNEVILYTIDYVPNRFSNPILNYLYHYFDKQCLKECKIIWNVSPAMVKAREDVKGLKKENYAPQITVPLGVWYDRIPRLELSKKRSDSLIYMGHLIEKQGVDLVIGALPYILKDIPSITLTIVGTGSYENKLKTLVKKKKLEKYVEFKGYVESHQEVERILSESTVGLAMYKPIPENYTYFADPGKLKNYLAAGLPVILTDVPPIALDLKKSKCALISSYDPEILAKNVVKLLKDKKILEQYHQNAMIYAKSYDWNDIFEKALSLSLK
ncbi:hypothetical protein BH09PAT1_BH09PAT1_6160 [soil metagenome]